MDWEKRYECHDTSQQVGQIKKENDQHENDQHGNNYEKDRPPPAPVCHLHSYLMTLHIP